MMQYDHTVPLRGRMRRCIREFYEQWGDILSLATGAFLIVIAIAVVVISLNIRQTSADAARKQADSQRTAHAQCLRTRQFGPQLGNFFINVQAALDIKSLSDEFLRQYTATIPKSCP